MQISTIRSQVFTLANKLRKALGSLGAAMKKAWAIIKVRIGLQKEVKVTFVKKDGTKTTRRVTRIKGNYSFKGSDKKTPATLLKFVDVDKMEAGIKFNIISFHVYQIAA